MSDIVLGESIDVESLSNADLVLLYSSLLSGHGVSLDYLSNAQLVMLYSSIISGNGVYLPEVLMNNISNVQIME
ncbi:MAG: hypothetical protein ACOCRZ_02655 [Halothermotrichaceae bacterium]